MEIKILGITDPEGESVNITILGITSDEPTTSVAGAGKDKDEGPDGKGIDTSTAQVRSERSGTMNGRVYEIIFKAVDSQAAVTIGSVKVSVPFSMDGNPAIDDGQNFDATKIN